MEENKIVQLNPTGKINFQQSNTENHERDLNSQGENTMNKDNYVTHQELKHFEEKIDLKFENIHTKFGGEFQAINIKIDNLPNLFENMLLKNEKEQEEKRKQTNQYIWGTIIIGGLGLIISIISLFF